METKTYALSLDGPPEEVDFIADDGGAVRVLLESVARQFFDLPARLFVERLAEIAVVFHRFGGATCTNHHQKETLATRRKDG